MKILYRFSVLKIEKEKAEVLHDDAELLPEICFGFMQNLFRSES